MLQTALIIFSFLTAIYFLGRQFYKSFFSKDVHCAGCSGCSAIDFQEIENKMAKDFNKN